MGIRIRTIDLTVLLLILLLAFMTGCQKTPINIGDQVPELTETTINEFLSRFEQFIEDGDEEYLPFFISKDVRFQYSFKEYNIHIRYGGFKRLKTQLFFESFVSVGTDLERTVKSIDIFNYFYIRF